MDRTAKGRESKAAVLRGDALRRVYVPYGTQVQFAFVGASLRLHYALFFVVPRKELLC